jgi:chromosome segregation ATPase
MKAFTKSTLIFLAGTALLSAQTPEEQQEQAVARLRESLRATTTELRNAQGEVATAQAAQVQAEREIKKVSDQLQNVTAKAEADKKLANDAIQELSTSREKALAHNAELVAAIGKWKEAYEKVAATAQAKQGESATLSARVIELEREVDAREQNNLELYRVGKEILERYENFGLGKAILAREPFTGIARVTLENQVQDYKERLLEHKDKLGQVPAVDTPPAPATDASPNRP